MKAMNLKSILRNYLGFINFRTMIKLDMWWIWPRRKRVFFIFEGREYTYKEVYQRAQDFARFFSAERKKLIANGSLPKDARLSVGIYVDNIPEFMFASLAAGLSNSILFAINTGFRGETLAAVINQSKIAMLIINSSTIAELERVIKDINIPDARDIIYAGLKDEVDGRPYRILNEAVDAASSGGGKYSIPPIDNFSPVIVIYTSGTTGVPKGVPCTHAKMLGAGLVVQMAIWLTKKDRGYISMPLFHSNAWYIGILPQLIAGAALS